MNPFEATLKFLGLNLSTAQGDWMHLALLLTMLSDQFDHLDNAGSIIHQKNPPQEVLRRIALVTTANGHNESHAFRRVEQLLTPAVIAHDSR